MRACGRRPRNWRAAVNANVVLPAPGVATVRKSGSELAESWSRARFCQARSRIVRVTSGGAEEGGERSGEHGRVGGAADLAGRVHAELGDADVDRRDAEPAGGERADGR